MKYSHSAQLISIRSFLKKIALWCFVAILFQSCSRKSIQTLGNTTAQTDDSAYIDSDASFTSHFTGISVYSISEEKTILDYNAEKLFIPASNIKILTLYSALSLLPDSLTTFYYTTLEDTLYIYPNADPTFLHPKFSQSIVLDFLNSWEGSIAILESSSHNRYFGSGWAWDDFPYYYQAEISDFPIFGNSLFIETENNQSTITPQYFTDSIVYYKKGIDVEFSRDLRKNTFHIPHKWKTKKAIQIPFVTSKKTTQNILQSILRKNVTRSNTIIGKTKLKPFVIVAKDTVLKKMMLDSDNFIAEQMISMIGNEMSKKNRKDIFNSIQDSIFNYSNKDLRWVDGSGLSRYNLISPKFITSTLIRLYRSIGMEKIKYYFPSGGISSGLTNYTLKENEKPCFYAKTGTLRNNHCLSGFLITDRNNILVFSIMNNNFYGGSSTVKPSMGKLLRRLKEKY